MSGCAASTRLALQFTGARADAGDADAGVVTIEGRIERDVAVALAAS
jgi:hypothetical protein